MAKKPKYTVCGYVLQPDGGYKPFESLTPEERADWEERARKRLSETVSRCINANPEAHRAMLEKFPDVV